MTERLLWAKMPTNWIRFDNGLCNFRSQELAASVAALKIYLMLCLQANRTPTPILPEAGLAHVSYTHIMQWADLARATITKGITKLQCENLVNIDEVCGKNLYQIVNYTTRSGWAKLPTTLVRSGVVKQISARSKIGLSALKLYMLLLAHRSSKSPYTSIGYDKIQAYTNIRRNDILPAVSLLSEARLITSDRDLRFGDNEFNYSQYFIHGLGFLPHTREFPEPNPSLGNGQ